MLLQLAQAQQSMIERMKGGQEVPVQSKPDAETPTPAHVPEPATAARKDSGVSFHALGDTPTAIMSSYLLWKYRDSASRTRAQLLRLKRLRRLLQRKHRTPVLMKKMTMPRNCGTAWMQNSGVCAIAHRPANSRCRTRSMSYGLKQEPPEIPWCRHSSTATERRTLQ